MFMRDTLQAPGQLPFPRLFEAGSRHAAAATGKTGKIDCRHRQHLAAPSTLPGNSADFSRKPGNWHAHC
jgi:hypothetical protein